MKRMIMVAAAVALVGLGGGTAVAVEHSNTPNIADVSASAPAVVTITGSTPECALTATMHGTLWDGGVEEASANTGTSLETFVGTVSYHLTAAPANPRRRTVTLPVDYEASVTSVVGTLDRVDQFIGTGPTSGMGEVLPSQVIGTAYYTDATGVQSPSIDICSLFGLGRPYASR